MSSTDRKSPSDEYLIRISVVALSKCDNEHEAGELVAQQYGLAPHIDRALAQAGELVESKQVRQALALLDEMIDRVDQFTRPYPRVAVREVFGYNLTRLYFQRALARFSSATVASDLEATLADLDRADGYPTATFADLDPEMLVAKRDFRTIVEAMLKG